MALWKWLKFITITAIILKVEARPSCFSDNGGNLICTPGEENYTLIKGLVSDNNNTVTISLRACRISSIDLESFSGLFSVKSIDISRNKISTVKFGVLDGANKLKHLNISHNDLKNFSLPLFDHNPNLEVLDLKGNMINTIQQGLFEPLKKLKHLDLSSNFLVGANLSPHIFDGNQQIQILDFSRNNMDDSEPNLLYALITLESLNLNGCLLTEVPEFVVRSNLKTLKHLNIASNQIGKLENPNTFINLENLEILNLAENIIETINVGVFKPLKKIKVVTLRNNRLKELPDTLFNNIPTIGNVDLSHNAIENVPVNAFRGAVLLKNLNLATNKFTYLQDNFCLELRNSGVKLKKFYFNQNPWQCACLNQLFNEVKSFGIEYNSVKFNGDEPVCVTTNEFNCKRHQEFNEIYVDMYENVLKN